MSTEEFIRMVEEARNRIVEANAIKYPEYDQYINGWDDCICFLEDHIAELSSAS